MLDLRSVIGVTSISPRLGFGRPLTTNGLDRTCLKADKWENDDELRLHR